ncbi:hypothetical protein F4780DRAFT_589437 [Xylariomycetidae sp. FL0641]|nr:hypothetical protein F4780DRAFT_589437 [Xylariomycetidae sp. FL0641]
MCDMRAFGGTEYTYWWGAAGAMRAWNERRIRRRFRDPRAHQFKVVDAAAGSSHRVVAWARWEEPAAGLRGLREGSETFADGDKGQEGAGGERAGMLAPPEGADRELFAEFFDAMTAVEGKWGAGEKLTLTHVCTLPAYHGRGLGAALVTPVLALADAERVPAFVASLRLAVPFYRRLGYEPVDRLVFDLRTRAGKEGSADIEILVRQPRNGV